jgi:D-sedoheptulose 7-phosphate isomerase
MTDKIRTHFEEAASVLENFMAQSHNYQLIADAATLMANATKQGGKILSCGNGGSMADAMHFAEELTGRFRADRKPIAAIAIADATHISCTANDYGYDYIFSRYIEALGRPGDVLLAISTSGNSTNVLKAVEAAKANGMQVVALTGKDGGKLATLANIEIRVAHHGFADRIQEVHIKIIHALIDSIEGLQE